MLFDLRRRTDVLHLLTLMVLLSLPALVSYNTMTQLEAIQNTGTIRVATRNTPNAFFYSKGKEAGFEYDLSKAFADYLGVEIDLSTPGTIQDLFQAIDNRDVHIAAAGLNISEERLKKYEFSHPYSSSIATVIYRETRGKKAPKSVEDLIGKDILVLANSSQSEILKELQKTNPELKWSETSVLTSTDILDNVFNKTVDYAIVDSTVYQSQRSFYPGLKAGFTIGDTQPIAWLLTPNRDGSIKNAVDKFLQLPETIKLIAELKEKYFSKQNPLNYFDTVTFKKDFETRLPDLEPHFRQAAKETGIDWMLLASIAYQESHWKTDAVSPTGVKGIMMLTNAAAKEVGVTDRTDPIQSIIGGAHYLVSVQKKIPDRIPEPDHTWFALAGYNVGFGHLEDARRLTQNAGKNPDKWEDVRQFLPFLSVEKYYKNLRYGYARGQEPVHYVKNIQKYIELLTWEKQIQQIRRDREASIAAERAEQEAYPAEETIIEREIPSTL